MNIAHCGSEYSQIQQPILSKLKYGIWSLSQNGKYWGDTL